MNFNIATIIDAYRQEISQHISPKTLEALNNLITNISKDILLNSYLPYPAYMLATDYHETGGRMYPITEERQPIYENMSPRQQEVRRLQDKYWDTGFYGRGIVQITWEENYSMMSKLLKQHYPDIYDNKEDNFLVNNPDLALDPNISYHIMSVGLMTGAFNRHGYGLPYYLDKEEPDWVNARLTVNVDVSLYGESIAEKALKFLNILQKAKK